MALKPFGQGRNILRISEQKRIMNKDSCTKASCHSLATHLGFRHPEQHLNDNTKPDASIPNAN